MQLEFNDDVWCLQCRNIRKLITTVHNIHNTTSSHDGPTPLLYKFIFISKNHTG